jgi:hypothetical protein
VSDATNEVRLWRVYGYRRFQDDWSFEEPAHTGPEDACEYIARPRADDDAREERLKEAQAMVVAAATQRGELLASIERYKARAEKAEQQRDALAQECSETEHVAREAGCDESIRRFPVALHDLLTRLTRERDEARALLREARRAVEMAADGAWLVNPNDRKRHGATLARIDAALDNPTPDDRISDADRKGEDGAWVEGSAE